MKVNLYRVIFNAPRHRRRLTAADLEAPAPYVEILE
jgi:hypothetical protein